jgi:hypothetical protein
MPEQIETPPPLLTAAKLGETLLRTTDGPMKSRRVLALAKRGIIPHLRVAVPLEWLTVKPTLRIVAPAGQAVLSPVLIVVSAYRRSTDPEAIQQHIAPSPSR